MSNRTYDVLKYVAQVGLPALITLYGVIGATWEIANTDKIMTTAAAVNVALGAVLGLSAMQYKKENDK